MQSARVKQAGRHLNPERRDRILRAAEDLFLRNGLRGTSMEAIARAAGVAKPTLYAYFSDKDAVFATLAERILDEWRTLVTREMGGPGAAPERIARALTAKIKAYFRLTHMSPHAAALYAPDSGLLMEQVAEFEGWLEEELVAALMAERFPDARHTVQVLLACATGLAISAKFIEEIGPATRLVVSKLLA